MRQSTYKASARLSRLLWKWCLVIGMTTMLAGCGNSGGDQAAQADAGLPVEAVAVRQAFTGSGPSYENPLSEMLKLVKAGKDNPAAYTEVIPQLQRLASNPTITAEKKQSLEALVEKLKADLATPQP
jgi:hypothetical protein